MRAARAKVIAFVSHSSQLGGSEQLLYRLLCGLDRRQFDPVVLLPRPGPLGEKLQAIGVRTRMVRQVWWVALPQVGTSQRERFLDGLEKRVEETAALLREERAEAVFTSTSVIAEGALAAKLSGIPHVWLISENYRDNPELTPIHDISTFYSLIAQLSTSVSTVSRCVQAHVQGYVDWKDIEMTYPGVELPTISAPPAPRPGAPVLVFVGRLTKAKGILDLVQAAPRVFARFPDCRFRIVGADNGALAEAQRMVAGLGLQRAFEFLGFRDDRLEVMAAADVLVVPSHVESFSLVCVEAMLLGKPVVATACGGPSEIIVDGGTGHLTPVGDPERFADAILDVLSDTARAERMGIAGRHRAEQFYSYRRFIGQTEELLGRAAKTPTADWYTREAGKALLDLVAHGYRRAELQMKTADAQPKRARVIAFYLPQFHPTPENDLWWGKGFTEWTNVAKAKPLFPGHDQPRFPADLGYYDLRVPETRVAQAELARRYGVEAFCYWHYWFGGKRLLHRPFEEVLAAKEPDFPFCLAWANQSWTGIWHGAPDRMLMEQVYDSGKDDDAHFRVLSRAFMDPRYLRVDGKPLFIVYDPKGLPDSRRTTDRWRELALRDGHPGLYLLALIQRSAPWDPRGLGFDGAVLSNQSRILAERESLHGESLPIRWQRDLRGRVPNLFDYRDAMRFFLSRKPVDYPCYPCVVPNWDNSPRSGKSAMIFHNSTPELFRIHAGEAFEMVQGLPPSERLVFVKSWNEWAEGNYVEPDLRYGHGYLQVIKSLVDRSRPELAQAAPCDAIVPPSGRTPIWIQKLARLHRPMEHNRPVDSR